MPDMLSLHNYLPDRITGVAGERMEETSLFDHRREIANDFTLDESAYFRSLQNEHHK